MRIGLLAACAWGVACSAAADPWFRDVTGTHLPPAPEAGYATMDAVAADLDGDGDLDLVTPQEWRANRILLNDGGGRFVLAEGALPPIPESELVRPAHIQRALMKDSEDVSIADFDGDGVPDFVIVTEDDVRLGRSNVHQYYRGLGGNRYERRNGALPDTVANAVAHADVSGDGALDLIISGDGQDRMLINDGRGGFIDETEARIPREAAVAQDVQFFDADGDGDLDIVLGLEGGHALWINNGAGVFEDESRARLPAPGNVEARKVVPADVDGDGDLDLYFAHVSWQGRAPQDRLFINDGRGRFSDGTAARLPQGDLLSLDAAFADLDGDGDLDLVQGNGGSVRVYANDGGGRFSDVTVQALGVDVPGTSITVEVADFNGDGRPDIFIGQLALPGGGAAQDRLFLNIRRRR
ncbi:MAG: VCBS repeat-containing protein [Hyphomonadaceae bacterium]|nr:VCBS repeat-containing protein [Hyphomonadaceae bacterium]MBX3510173.1 VCBS repeat-containing protein [Hyphomonadaceae bacterium]